MAQIIPKPDEKDIEMGWTAGCEFVKQVSERATDKGWPVGMEEAQCVIDVLVELGYLDISE